MQALLDAIRARPDDDEPRLVYADWLTDQGDPRGEFIHVQCSLERVPWWDSSVLAMRLRAQELLLKHRADWEPTLATNGRFGWAFERGFPIRIEGSGRDVLAAAEEIIDEVPTIRSVLTTRFDVHPESFLSSPLLPRLKALSLHYLPQPPPTRDVLLRVLLNDPRMQHLKRLRISYTYLNLAEWDAIAGSTLLARLESLDMALGNATDECVALLLGVPSSLRSLGVSNCRVGTGGARAIAQSLHSRRLEELDLGWNRVGIKGARAIAESEQLERLAFLDLSHCQVGDEGCEAIAAGRLIGLKGLKLEHSRIGAKGARALAESVALKGMVWVDLKDNGLDAETLGVLRARFPNM